MEMKCPKCGSENPLENKYCSNCKKTISTQKWSLHDHLYWNLTQEEKHHRLKLTGLFVIIIVLFILFLLMEGFIGASSATIYITVNGAAQQYYDIKIDGHFLISGFLDSYGIVEIAYTYYWPLQNEKTVTVTVVAGGPIGGISKSLVVSNGGSYSVIFQV